MKCNGANSNTISAGNLSLLSVVSLANGGFCLFRPFSDYVVYDTTTFFSFFFFINEEKFSLWLTKLLQYLSHILLKFNKIGYYFLPCLLTLLFVPHKTMLIVSDLYYTSLQFIFHRSYFLHKKQEMKDEALCPDYLFSEDDRLFRRVSGNGW